MGWFVKMARPRGAFPKMFWPGVLVFLGFTVGPILAAEIFVDPLSAEKKEQDGSAARPWGSLPEAIARLSPGDVLSLRPGVYRQEQIRVTMDRVILRRDPAIPGVAVIDGGVPLHELRNQDAQGRQKTSHNGPFFLPAVEVTGQGVTLENLEIRHGYVGVSVRGEKGTVRACHVHHVGQHGIEVMSHAGRVEDCLVHDANLYNVNGQCLLSGKEPGKDRPNQNARKKINSPDPKRHGQNMDWGQGITFHGKYRGAWAPRGAVLRRNVVWNIWGEGIATYNASEVRMEGNAAFNIWRVAYYVQNADEVVLDRNLALYERDFRSQLGDGAMAVGFSFANEYPADHLRQSGGSGQSLVPDGSDLTFTRNISWRGDYAFHSGDNHRVGTRGGAWIRNNLFLFPAFAPCINLNGSVSGPLRITGNLLAREGLEKEEPGRFLALAEGIRARSKHNRMVQVDSTDPRVKMLDESVLNLGHTLDRTGADFRKELFSGLDTLRQLFADFRREK